MNIEYYVLYDDAGNMKIGDKIKFQVLDKEIYLQVEVTNKYIYDDFEEFWKDKDIVLSSAKNYTKEECKNKLYEIFGKERVNNSKLVAIEFKIINN